jgi:hypothetical protein
VSLAPAACKGQVGPVPEHEARTEEAEQNPSPIKPDEETFRRNVQRILEAAQHAQSAVEIQKLKLEYLKAEGEYMKSGGTPAVELEKRRGKGEEVADFRHSMPMRSWDLLPVPLFRTARLSRICFKQTLDKEGKDIGILVQLKEREKQRVKDKKPSEDYASQLMKGIEEVDVIADGGYIILGSISRFNPNSEDYKYLEESLRNWCNINIEGKPDPYLVTVKAYNERSAKELAERQERARELAQQYEDLRKWREKGLEVATFKDAPYRRWEMLPWQIHNKARLSKIYFKHPLGKDGQDLGVLVQLKELEKQRIKDKKPYKDYVSQLMESIEEIQTEVEGGGSVHTAINRKLNPDTDDYKYLAEELRKWSDANIKAN